MESDLFGFLYKFQISLIRLIVSACLFTSVSVVIFLIVAINSSKAIKFADKPDWLARVAVHQPLTLLLHVHLVCISKEMRKFSQSSENAVMQSTKVFLHFFLLKLEIKFSPQHTNVLMVFVT